MHEENRFCFGLQFVVGELIYQLVCTQQQHETKTVYFSFDLTFCIATTHEHERQKKMCEKNIGKKQHGESVNTNTHQQITNKNGSFRADIALTKSSVRAVAFSLACE